MPVRVRGTRRIHKRFLIAESCTSSASDGSKWKRLKRNVLLSPGSPISSSRTANAEAMQKWSAGRNHCYGAGDCSYLPCSLSFV